MSVWNQTASKGLSGEGGAFEKPPAGNHLAVCVAIIDMGTQRKEYKGKETTPHRAYFCWELLNCKMTGTTGRNHVIGIDLTLSLAETATLRAWIEGRLGTRLTNNVLYSINQELGQPCMLNVIKVAKGEKDYPKIDGVTAIEVGRSIPMPQNKPILAELADVASGRFIIPEWIPWLYGEHLMDHIRRCEEIRKGVVTLAPGVASTPPPSSPSPTAASPSAPASPTAGDRWDYSDGVTRVNNATTAEVLHMLGSVSDPSKIRVKPAGSPPTAVRVSTEWPQFAPAPATDIPW